MLRILPVLCILVWFGVFLRAQTYTKAQTEKRVLELLRAYDPRGYEIVISATNQKSKYDFSYCGGGVITVSHSGSILAYIDIYTEKGILEDISTVVHELTHAYVGHPYDEMVKNRLCTDKDYHVYPLSNQLILVPINQTFPSKMLASYIPPDKRTFRYSDYITGTSSTQSEGVYGLLDEWHAYYRGAFTWFQLRNYYLNQIKNPQDWIGYFSDIYELTAYYEFKYFILTYLLYAKKNQPRIYEQIINNESFKKVFNYVDTEYGRLISDYIRFRDSLLTELKNSGVRVLEIEGNICIVSRCTRDIQKNEDVTRLQAELNKPEYLEMMRLLR